MTNIQTQCELIRNHLMDGKCISPIEALNFFGCMRLGARIWDLREQGMAIQSRSKKLKNGKRVAEYYLLQSEINRQNKPHEPQATQPAA